MATKRSQPVACPGTAFEVGHLRVAFVVAVFVHWEGDVLVIEVTSFDDSTWLGERSYFHTEAMTATERLFLDGERLIYQETVDDLNVLAEPWTSAPRAVTPDGLPLQESAPCIDEDALYFINDDQHIQRR